MTIKKAILRGLLGIPIGVFIMTLIGLGISLSLGKLALISPAYLGNPSDLTAYTVQFLLSCAIGFNFSMASSFFEIENWSLGKQTFIHFIATSIVYFPTAIYLGWMELKLFSVIQFVAIYCLSYLIVWFTIYLSMKKKIQSLNAGISKTK